MELDGGVSLLKPSYEGTGDHLGFDHTAINSTTPTKTKNAIISARVMTITGSFISLGRGLVLRWF